jgi:TatD DNase family protein
MVLRVSARQREKPPAPEPLAPLIDAHTHLDACGAQTAADVAAILEPRRGGRVAAVVTIADDLDAARWATPGGRWDSRVYAAVALHPTRANALDDAARAELETLAADPRCGGRGDRIDMYWPGKLDGCADPATQRDAFAWHIDLAKRTGKPLMIHNRDGDAEVLDVLAAEGRRRR